MVCIVVFSTLFSLTLALISTFVGQLYQSTNTSIIAAIIVVAILGNFLANLYQINNIIIILLSMIVLVFIIILLKSLANRVQKDDIIEENMKK